jgi:hypothetical protein
VLPLPSVADLSAWSGRPESSYTTYATSAILQAALMMTIQSENDITDYNAFDANDQLLITHGIMAMADYIYLRQPYQAVIASPLMNETVGSYSYAKASQEIARNAAAGELQGERTGVGMYDLAIQFLAKRTRAGGVYFGEILAFEITHKSDGVDFRWDCEHGAMRLYGPSDMNQFDVPFDVNAPMFPMDPGI